MSPIFEKIGLEDLYGGESGENNTTFSRISRLNPTTTITLNKSLPYINARTHADLNTAIEAIGSTETDLIIDSQITMTGDLTTPSTCRLVFTKGGSINQSTYTLTINGPIDAGPYKIFDGSGTVTINSTQDTNISIYYPQWWGNLTGDNNVFIGLGAGKAGTTGASNVFIGNDAGTANTTGVQSVFIGHNAGKANTTGVQSVFIGSGAGGSITSAVSNVFIGVDAGASVTTAGYSIGIGHNAGKVNAYDGNTFIGYNAGAACTTGFTNTFIGYIAGQGITTAFSNTLIGYNCGAGALTGNNNVFIGDAIAPSATTAYGSVIIGSAAGGLLTTGYRNVFIGTSVGYENTTGDRNVAVGTYAFSHNTTGSRNTVIGTDAMLYNTTGGFNVAIGRSALEDQKAGSSNTVVGVGALQEHLNGANNVVVGANANQANIVGATTTVIGTYAGQHVDAGDDNVYVGAYSGEGASGASSSTLEMDFQDSDLDDETDTHTPVANGTLTYNTAETGDTRLGVSLSFPGTIADYVSVPEVSSSFDFATAGRMWVATFVRIDDLSVDRGIFAHAYNGATSDYIWLYVTTTGSVELRVVEGSATVVTLSTAGSLVTAGTSEANTHHIALLERGDTWTIYVDGVSSATTTDTSRTEGAQTYDSDLIIGAVDDGTTISKPFSGLMGIFMLSNLPNYGQYNTFVGYQAGRKITTGIKNVCLGYQADLPAGTTSYHINLGGVFKYDLITITNAQIKALVATPKELVAAPGAGYLIEMVSLTLFLDYSGGALAEPTAPDDLAVEYDNGTGTQITTWDTTGFITATADSMEIRYGASVGGGASAIANATNVNKNLVLINTGGEYTGAASTSTIEARIVYRVHSTT